MRIEISGSSNLEDMRRQADEEAKQIRSDAQDRKDAQVWNARKEAEGRKKAARENADELKNLLCDQKYEVSDAYLAALGEDSPLFRNYYDEQDRIEAAIQESVKRDRDKLAEQITMLSAKFDESRKQLVTLMTEQDNTLLRERQEWSDKLHRAKYEGLLNFYVSFFNYTTQTLPTAGMQNVDSEMIEKHKKNLETIGKRLEKAMQTMGIEVPRKEQQNGAE